MTESYELEHPDRFTTGTVGPPGQRTFFLQAQQGSLLLTLKLEKQQVAALCDYLAGILADLPPAEEATVGDLELHEPIEPAWVVGSLAVAYEQADDRILLVAEELLIVDDDDLAELGELTGLDDLAAAADLLPEPSTARFHLRRAQVAAFIEQGMALVAASRPTCRLCQRPIDPGGHQCPRLN